MSITDSIVISTELRQTITSEQAWHYRILPKEVSGDEFKFITCKDNQPSDLLDAMFVGDPCQSCEIYPICGGRCLYANKLKPWGEEGYKKTCETIFYLVNALKKQLPSIKKMLEDGTIKDEQFEYFQYNGCEIVP